MRNRLCMVWGMNSSKIIIKGATFGKKGIRVSGKYFPAWYSRSTLINGAEAVTVYAKCILTGLPDCLKPQNDSDMMTDYFEKDRVRFYSGTPEYSALIALCS